MKTKLFVLLPFFLLASVAVLAQEEQPINDPPESTHRETIRDENRTFSDDQFFTAVPRDTTHAVHKAVPGNQRNTAKPHKGEKEENETDALSFNFLYYMFQKFKLSDLIDD